MEKKLFSASETCKILNISRSTLDRLVEIGDIKNPITFEGMTKLYWTMEDIDECIENRKKKRKKS